METGDAVAAYIDLLQLSGNGRDIGTVDRYCCGWSHTWRIFWVHVQ